MCLKKGGHILAISFVSVTTKHKGYMDNLGIHTDYTLVLVIVIVMSFASVACLVGSVARLYILKTAIESDSSSSRGIIVSPSQTGSENNNSYMERDDSFLVDNEVTSPVAEDHHDFRQESWA